MVVRDGIRARLDRPKQKQKQKQKSLERTQQLQAKKKEKKKTKRKDLTRMLEGTRATRVTTSLRKRRPMWPRRRVMLRKKLRRIRLGLGVREQRRLEQRSRRIKEGQEVDGQDGVDFLIFISFLTSLILHAACYCTVYYDTRRFNQDLFIRKKDAFMWTT